MDFVDYDPRLHGDALNILIRKSRRDLDTEPPVVAEVRYKYSPITDDGSVISVKGRSVWDANATNRVGIKGARREVVSMAELESAVALLVERFGPMTVQNNLPTDMIDREGL